MQDAGFNAPEPLEGDEGDEFDDDGDDVKEQMARLRAAREAHCKQTADREVKAKEYLHKRQVGVSSSASGPSDPGPSSSRQRGFVAMPCSGPPLGEAKQWLPPGATLSKDCVREKRWRIRFRAMGGEKSKSFGRHSSKNTSGHRWSSCCSGHGGPTKGSQARLVRVLSSAHPLEVAARGVGVHGSHRNPCCSRVVPYFEYAYPGWFICELYCFGSW